LKSVDDKMKAEYSTGKDLEVGVLAVLEIISRYLSGGTEECQGNLSQ
jgi:hypothetical protein